jgi:ADP-ribosylation factor-like protein 2
VVWVVDSSDRLRLGDCRQELRSLLQEEVGTGAQTLQLLLSYIIKPEWL